MLKNGDLILETSLQTFFFDQLAKANQILTMPLPNVSIYYSSLVMDKFSDSTQYFEVVDGKTREKILGTKLLEANSLDRSAQKRAFKDIGDSALFMCGYFYDSINEKIVDYRYYKEIGQLAYSRLNSIVPSFYDVEEFYKQLSSQFEMLTTLLKIVQQQTNDPDQMINAYLLSQKNIKAS